MKFFKFNRSGNVVIVSKNKSEDTQKPQNGSDLSRAVAKTCGVSRADVDKVMNCYLEEITTSLIEGRPVLLSGFGKFKLRKPRTGSCRNPNTGKKMAAPQRKSVCFQPSLVIKQKLNDGAQKHA